MTSLREPKALTIQPMRCRSDQDMAQILLKRQQQNSSNSFILRVHDVLMRDTPHHPIMWKTGARLRPPSGEYSHGYEDRRGFCAPQGFRIPRSCPFRHRRRRNNVTAASFPPAGILANHSRDITVQLDARSGEVVGKTER
jgi:hypothetical protein